MREFCIKYGGRVLEIHQEYFKHHEKSSNIFEEGARTAIEERCCEMWKEYLGSSLTPIKDSLDYQGHKQWRRLSGKKGYELRVAQTNTVIQDHSFDCYAELLHNDASVAKAYGEAKNYDLLTEHLKTFKDWLCAVSFNAKREIPDLAYFFAPGCPTLLKMKIENSDIQVIHLPKQENEKPVAPQGIDINQATFEQLCTVLKGSSVRKKTIEKLIKLREEKHFCDLDELTVKLNSTTRVKEWLQKKISDSQIYFGQSA